MKRILFTATVFLIVLMLMGVDVQKAEASEIEGETTVNLNVRSSPSTTGVRVTTLPKGTRVRYEPYTSTWHRVSVGGRMHYASARYIRPVAPSPKKPVVTLSTGVTTANLNVRATPQWGARVITTLKKGTEVRYSAHDASWLKVSINGGTYFVAKSYVAPKPSSAPAARPPAPGTQYVPGHTTRDVKLFARPHQGATVIRSLAKHTPVSYRKYNASWSVVTVGGVASYIPSAWLKAGAVPKASAPRSAGKVFTNTPGDGLNVRASASTRAAILGTLTHGTQVEHYGTANGFHRITYKGRDGYIASTFTTATRPGTGSAAVVVLDAGHGGVDPGAVSGSFYEKTVVLDVTKRVESTLRSRYGYEARLTRSSDVAMTLAQRVQAARTLKGNLFVSIHANAAGNPVANGLETFYSTSTAHRDKSRVLATNVQKRLMGQMPGMTNRGVKTANYYVIAQNAMPSALVEIGFISSPRDVALLRDSASRQRMAEGIAEGIAEYARVHH